MDGPDDNAGTMTPEALLASAMEAQSAGDMSRAAQALDAALKSVPNHPLPLRLRARVALERGEADALARYDRALRADPGNPDLHLGKAQALEMAGDLTGARIVAEQIAAQAPGFIAALSYLSGLYLAAGEADFTAPFGAAARKAPQDPNIMSGWVNALSGIERFDAAANVAMRAADTFPKEPHFALLEAINAGSAGEWDRAEAIYAQLGVQSLQRWLAEARHRLRVGDVGAAQDRIDQALASWPHDIAAWALQGLIWRLTDTPEAQSRAHWLHGQKGLVQVRKLQAPDGLLDRVRARLTQMHASAGMPLSQSVRGGSQTQGVLFHRPDPELAQLHEAIRDTLAAYRDALPKADPAHPLLRTREEEYRLAGSWSVRLSGGGDHHSAHIHPAGLVSSALYLSLPDTDDATDKPGWLEIGRPPANLNLDLDPMVTIEPKEGYLALFPSTLYHGTRPFQAAAGRSDRVTIAFDVITKSRMT